MKRAIVAVPLVLLAVSGAAMPTFGQTSNRIYIPISQRNAVGNGPEVGLLSSSAYLDDVGDLHVMGELRNDAAWTQTAVQVALTFRDAAGNALDTSFGFALVDTLAPGGVAPFNVTVTDPPAGYRSIGLSAEGTSGPVVQDVLVAERMSAETDPDGYYTVSGWLRNSSSAPVVDPVAVVTMYDDAGAIIGAGAIEADDDTIAPGASSFFELSYLPQGRVARYRVIGQSGGADDEAYAAATLERGDQGAGDKKPSDEKKGGDDKKTPTRAATASAATTATVPATPTAEERHEKPGEPERADRPEEKAPKPETKNQKLRVDWSPRKLEGVAAPGTTFSGTVKLSALSGGGQTVQIIAMPRRRASAISLGGAGSTTATPAASATVAALGTTTPTGSATAVTSATATGTAAASATPTGTAVGSATATPTAAGSATATPTAGGSTTATATASSNMVVQSVGIVALQVGSTETATATATASTPSATATAGTPSATATAGTPSATATVGTPSATATAGTGTATSTRTPGTGTATPTEVRRTVTATATRTPETRTPTSTRTAVPVGRVPGSFVVGTVNLPATGSIDVPITVQIPANFRGTQFNAELFVRSGRHPRGRPLKVRIRVSEGGAGSATATATVPGSTTATPATSGTATATVAASGTATATAVPTTPTATFTSTAVSGSATATATPSTATSTPTNTAVPQTPTATSTP